MPFFIGLVSDVRALTISSTGFLIVVAVVLATAVLVTGCGRGPGVGGRAYCDALDRVVTAIANDDGVDGAVLGPDAFVLRFLARDGDDRLLLVNLYRDLVLEPAPEPLLAPPSDGRAVERVRATLFQSSPVFSSPPM